MKLPNCSRYFPRPATRGIPPPTPDFVLCAFFEEKEKYDWGKRGHWGQKKVPQHSAAMVHCAQGILYREIPQNMEGCSMSYPTHCVDATVTHR